MAKKRITLNKNKRVKAIARARVGSVKPARILEPKAARETPKHKVDWTKGADE